MTTRFRIKMPVLALAIVGGLTLGGCATDSDSEPSSTETAQQEESEPDPAGQASTVQTIGGEEREADRATSQFNVCMEFQEGFLRPIIEEGLSDERAREELDTSLILANGMEDTQDNRFLFDALHEVAAAWDAGDLDAGTNATNAAARLCGIEVADD